MIHFYRNGSISLFFPQPIVSLAFAAFALAMGLLAFLVQIRDCATFPPGDSYHGGDTLSMATFAQALLQPELFSKDVFLANPNHMLVQDSLYLRLLMLLGRMVPDMAYGVALLSIPFIFLHLTGFYLLGRLLLTWRLGAIFFSLACFVTVDGFDGWAYSETPVSRAMVASLLPFLLAAFLYYRTTPEAWPWLMMAAGGLTYVHILNGPFLSLALWFGLLAFKPLAWSWSRMLMFMVLCGLASLAVQAPKILAFLNTMDLGERVDVALLREILLYNDRHNWLLRLPQTYKAYVGHLLQPLPLMVLLIALTGVGLMITRRMREPALGWFFVLVTSVLLLLGGVLPWLEDGWAKAQGRLPLLASAARNLPLLIPMLLMVCFYTLKQVADHGQRPRLGVAAMAMVWLAWQSAHGGNEWRNATTQLTCWRQGDLLCPPREDNQAGFYHAIRQVLPRGQPVLAAGYDYPLRLQVGAPLVFARRDQKYFIQTSKVETVRWYERSLAMDAIRRISHPQARLLAWRELARSWGARYVVFSRQDWQANRHETQAIANAFPTTLLHTPEVGIFQVE